jgi:hypothetical protein
MDCSTAMFILAIGVLFGFAMAIVLLHSVLQRYTAQDGDDDDLGSDAEDPDDREDVDNGDNGLSPKKEKKEFLPAPTPPIHTLAVGPPSSKQLLASAAGSRKNMILLPRTLLAQRPQRRLTIEQRLEVKNETKIHVFIFEIRLK